MTDTLPSPGGRRPRGAVITSAAGLAAAILAIAFLLRAPITAVPPVLTAIRDGLGLTAAQAGATTSLPLLCFGVFAFVTPFLVARLGLERTALTLLIPIAIGAALRSSGGVGLFFTGAVLVGCGIAIGNVVVPAFIRTRFPTRVSTLMGRYSAALQLSGAAGAAISVPLAADLGWGWGPAIGIWVAPVIGVLAWWLLLVRRLGRHDRSAVAPPTGLAHVASRPMSWAITAFMGLQSLCFYSMLTWLPAQLADRGLSTATAGLLLGVYSLIGLPGSFIAPRHAVTRHARPFLTGVIAMQIGALLLLGTGTAGAVVAVLLIGLAQGCLLPIALTYIAAQPDHADVPALSALAQGIGYLVAAAGPVIIGALLGPDHHWWAANLFVVAVSVTVLALGLTIAPRLYRLNQPTA